MTIEISKSVPYAIDILFVNPGLDDSIVAPHAIVHCNSAANFSLAFSFNSDSVIGSNYFKGADRISIGKRHKNA